MTSSRPLGNRTAGCRRKRTYKSARPAKPAQSAQIDTKNFHQLGLGCIVAGQLISVRFCKQAETTVLMVRSHWWIIESCRAAARLVVTETARVAAQRCGIVNITVSGRRKEHLRGQIPSLLSAGGSQSDGLDWKLFLTSRDIKSARFDGDNKLFTLQDW